MILSKTALIGLILAGTSLTAAAAPLQRPIGPITGTAVVTESHENRHGITTFAVTGTGKTRQVLVSCLRLDLKDVTTSLRSGRGTCLATGDLRRCQVKTLGTFQYEARDQGTVTWISGDLCVGGPAQISGTL